jgi:hypothetical protein
MALAPDEQREAAGLAMEALWELMREWEAGGRGGAADRNDRPAAAYVGAAPASLRRCLLTA